MAPKLGSRDPVFASPPEIRKDRLHDECCGIAKHVSAQDHENASIVSERTSGAETTVSGIKERLGKIGTHGIMGSGLESVHAAVGRSDPSSTVSPCADSKIRWLGVAVKADPPARFARPFSICLRILRVATGFNPVTQDFKS